MNCQNIWIVLFQTYWKILGHKNKHYLAQTKIVVPCKHVAILTFSSSRCIPHCLWSIRNSSAMSLSVSVSSVTSPRSATCCKASCTATFVFNLETIALGYWVTRSFSNVLWCTCSILWNHFYRWGISSYSLWRSVKVRIKI